MSEEIKERLEKLRREYRPSMAGDVCLSWAADVAPALSEALALITSLTAELTAARAGAEPISNERAAGWRDAVTCIQYCVANWHQDAKRRTGAGEALIAAGQELVDELVNGEPSDWLGTQWKTAQKWMAEADVLRSERDAALIRSAPAPGREEIARVIHQSYVPKSASWDRAYKAADAILVLFHAPADPGGGEDIEACDWPAKPFRFYDDPGKHDPCYVVMPDGAMIPLNHHAGEGVDVARAHFIVDACNAALAPEGMVRTAGAKLLTALERYGFPVSDAASTAAMSVEARDLHNAARRFKIAITSTKRAADEPAVTNGQ